MKRLYDLSEAQALALFEYPKEFHGMIFDETQSVIKYIFSLILFYLCFGFGLTVPTLFAYGHYLGMFDKKIIQHHVILSLIDLDNIFSKILYYSHIPLMLFLLCLTIFLFCNYLKHCKTNINRFHVYTHQVMLILLKITAFQALCLGFSIQPQLNVLTNILYVLLSLLIIFKCYRGFVLYQNQIINPATERDTNQIEKIIYNLTLISPFLIFIRLIIQAFSSEKAEVDYIRGMFYSILIFCFPYAFCIFADKIVILLLQSHLKHYYFNRYPEGFRGQIEWSQEKFYGPFYKKKEIYNNE
ncbi:hypothetical protein [Facklamia lactis]|uniref:hypothetical protein n=1 Tax=Facklamia lactis TaxID=2749967 RepID=UPI0018CF6DD9|nr:hypothetical protein [Facklamia lactis]MBG9980402.1 hypothetical protein [Facklamia lactis]